MLAGLEQGVISSGDVIIIRYEGPKGGPGMPEMLTPTSALAGAGFLDDVALITDGRFSGGSHGFIIGHVVPKPRRAVPSPSCETAIRSRSTMRVTRSASTSPMRSWPRAGGLDRSAVQGDQRHALEVHQERRGRQQRLRHRRLTLLSWIGAADRTESPGR